MKTLPPARFTGGMRTSIEIVPRDRASLINSVRELRAHFPGIDTVNLPDVARSGLTSIDAATVLKPIVSARIPHLRSRNTTRQRLERTIRALKRAGISEVIVIAGDPRDDDGDGMAPTTMITALNGAGFIAYAALDPYQYPRPDELSRNVDEKLNAGAAGFFTQPLFSLTALERCADILPETTVFWGLSPVASQRSQRYWERVNNVSFPDDFQPTLAWSQRFAMRFLSEVAARGDNSYLMPIKVDIGQYLAPIFAPEKRPLAR